MKKFVKFCFVGVVWSVLLFSVFDFILQGIWNFSLFRLQDWQLLSTFWNEGGVIRSFADYVFVLILIAILPIWIWGWKKALKIKIMALLAKPFDWYSAQKIAEYEQNTARIVLKNLGTSFKKESEEDEIKDELKKIEKDLDNSKLTAQIRDAVNQKISDAKK